MVGARFIFRETVFLYVGAKTFFASKNLEPFLPPPSSAYFVLRLVVLVRSCKAALYIMGHGGVGVNNYETSVEMFQALLNQTTVRRGETHLTPIGCPLIRWINGNALFVHAGQEHPRSYSVRSAYCTVSRCTPPNCKTRVSSSCASRGARRYLVIHTVRAWISTSLAVRGVYCTPVTPPLTLQTFGCPGGCPRNPGQIG